MKFILINNFNQPNQQIAMMCQLFVSSDNYKQILSVYSSDVLKFVDEYVSISENAYSLTRDKNSPINYRVHEDFQRLSNRPFKW